MSNQDNNSIRTFLQWWGEQLVSLLPTNWETRVDRSKSTVEIAIMDDKWILSNKGKKDTLPKRASISSVDEHSSEMLKNWLMKLSDPPSRLQLRIPGGHYLLREIELPLAAETTLHEALEFQIERITPFRLEDIYCHYGITEKNRAKKTLKAWLAVVPKRKIDALLTAFNNLSPQPLPPSFPSATADGETGTLSISYRLQTGENNVSWLTKTAASLLLINLLALAIYATIHLDNEIHQAAALHARLKEVKGRAMEAMDIEQHLKELEQQAEFIGNPDHTALMKVAIIEDLTKKIPDHTWIKQLDIKDGNITLVGYSENSASLIGQLEKSPFLSNVGFKSTVIMDRISGKERFSLSAILTNTEALKTDNSERDKNKDESTNRPQG